MFHLYGQWLGLPLATRLKLSQVFDIPKKHPTEVFSNQIKTDGFELKDIENGITVSSMQVYLGTTEVDPNVLWVMTIDKVEGRIPVAIVAEFEYSKPMPEVIKTDDSIVETLKEVIKPKKVVKRKTNGQTAKKTKK